GFRHEMPGIGRILFKLDSQLAHKNPQVLQFFDVLGPPHLFEQLSVSHDILRVSKHDLQKLVLIGGEVNLATSDKYSSRAQSNFDISKSDRSIRIGRLQAGRASEDRTYTCGDFAGRKGFRHVIISSRIQSLDLIALSCSGRYDDDRHETPFANFPNEPDAVPVGQSKIEEKQVRIPCCGLG